MISIAIALVLILGISQIFSLAQQTTGAGMNVLAAAETNRAVQTRLNEDFTAIDNGTDSPGLVIVSYAAAAFRNRVDMQGDGDGDPRTLNSPTGVGNITNPPEVVYRPDSRVHRLDRICFFARDKFVRQTGNSVAPISMTSPTTSYEAFVWLGHLALPNNAGITGYNGASPQSNPTDYINPGAGSLTATPANNNNFFASDWILGREAILLSPSPSEVAFLATNNALSILNAANTAGGANLFMSRYDLAGTSISNYHSTLTTTNYTWWEDLSGIQLFIPPTNPPAAIQTVKNNQRYWGNPFFTKPNVTGTAAQAWLSSAAAQASPVFVRGCTQFIVEFAGDYMVQNPATGAPTAAGQDGQVDYTVDSVTGAHHIRWYGYERDTNDDGTIDPRVDVVPVKTALAYYGIPMSNTAATFERFIPANYTLQAQGTNSSPYICAWGPDTDATLPRPKMIRITMAVDDPNGHLNTEQTFEYVFNLP